MIHVTELCPHGRPTDTYRVGGEQARLIVASAVPACRAVLLPENGEAQRRDFESNPDWLPRVLGRH